jgi:hypothetical protein
VLVLDADADVNVSVEGVNTFGIAFDDVLDGNEDEGTYASQQIVFEEKGDVVIKIRARRAAPTLVVVLDVNINDGDVDVDKTSAFSL